jgi:hypothetical protein
MEAKDMDGCRELILSTNGLQIEGMDGFVVGLVPCPDLAPTATADPLDVRVEPMKCATGQIWDSAM